jgi:hypothetical protein
MLAMSNPSPPPQDPASADEAPDPAVLRAERRLRLLEELAEIGMALARALTPAAEAREDPSDDKVHGKRRDPADAFGALSRAIRLTLALEARTDAELRDLKAGVVRVREKARKRAAKRARAAAARDHEDRRNRASYLVENLAEAEIGDGDEFENLCAALEERLNEDEAYFDCAKWPLREMVERLCKDLGLSPDWSRWTGDDWILHDADGRSFFSPFRKPSPIPLLNACPRPQPAQPPDRTPATGPPPGMRRVG